MVSIIVNNLIFLDGTLTGTITLGEDGPGSDGNEGVLHILQNSRTEASPSDGLVPYPGHLLGEELTPLQKCICHLDLYKN